MCECISAHRCTTSNGKGEGGWACLSEMEMHVYLKIVYIMLLNGDYAVPLPPACPYPTLSLVLHAKVKTRLLVFITLHSHYNLTDDLHLYWTFPIQRFKSASTKPYSHKSVKTNVQVWVWLCTHFMYASQTNYAIYCWMNWISSWIQNDESYSITTNLLWYLL